ncbi:MAG TPA: thymidine phosphorylase, partial [Vicinamibacteria bacterium]|nr:thymidine phosphorylase [Vicinamibacteria bacterium]
QRKRDGHELTPGEIAFFVEGYTRGTIPDYQASALAMAVFFKGMTAAETVALTESMMRTGEVLDLSELPGPKVDKHSTGGVGDKTSLVLAPLAAACGVYVPMISGRGLGHTGGTLDKLESIPGFRVGLSLDEFRAVLRKSHLGLIGQTPEIAPADRKLYALRDVTSTVESRPLIAASIMSKKMAEGIDALVLDVKTGDGAFMVEEEDSRALAEAMLAIGKGMGKRIVALITDMEQPLGRTVGNALEIVESIETLQGKGPADLETLSVELAAWMLSLAGAAPTLDAARAHVRSALSSGAGLKKFQEVIALQGGDPRVCDDLSRLPRAAETVELRAESAGRVTGIACRAVGTAAMLLGAGRETVDSRIDPGVGFLLRKKVGDLVAAGESLATVHVNDRRRLDEALAMLRRAIRVGPEAPAPRPLVHAVLQ